MASCLCNYIIKQIQAKFGDDPQYIFNHWTNDLKQ